MATLTVRRDEGWADSLRRYRIILDGVEIGRLGESLVLRQEIGEGPHTIEANIDWHGSQPLRFDSQPGEQTVIVSSPLRGWRVFLAAFYVIFRTREYLNLELRQNEPS